MVGFYGLDNFFFFGHVPWASQVTLALPVNAGGMQCKRCMFNLWVRRSPGEGHGNPLQYSCLENSKESGTWQTAVHRVTQSQTGVNRLSVHTGTGHGSESAES